MDGQQLDVGARLAYRLPRLLELDALGDIGGEDGDPARPEIAMSPALRLSVV